MKPTNQILIAATALSFASLAISQSLFPEINIPATYVPSEVEAVLSSLGNIGDIPLQNVDGNIGNIPLEGLGEVPLAAVGEVPLDGLDTVGAIEIPNLESTTIANVVHSADVELELKQTTVVASDQLIQVVAGNQITSSISGSRVDISETGDSVNSIVNSFNNVDVPIAQSQNSGVSSTVIQSIVLQIGIEIPTAASARQ